MENQIWKGLIAFIKDKTDIEVVFQGLQNRARIVDNCAIITFIEKVVQGTPKQEIDLENEVRVVGSQVLATYQIDVYGENSYEKISRLRTLLTDYVGFNFFKDYKFAPIMTTTIKNLTGTTLINEEYVKRFSMDLVISYRDNTLINTEFIDELTAITKEV